MRAEAASRVSARIPAVTTAPALPSGGGDRVVGGRERAGGTFGVQRFLAIRSRRTAPQSVAGDASDPRFDLFRDFSRQRSGVKRGHVFSQMLEAAGADDHGVARGVRQSEPQDQLGG